MPVLGYIPPAFFAASTDSCATPGWLTPPPTTDRLGVDVDGVVASTSDD